MYMIKPVILDTINIIFHPPQNDSKKDCNNFSENTEVCLYNTIVNMTIVILYCHKFWSCQHSQMKHEALSLSGNKHLFFWHNLICRFSISLWAFFLLMEYSPNDADCDSWSGLFTRNAFVLLIFLSKELHAK